MKAIGIVSYRDIPEIDFSKLARIPLHLRSSLDFVPDQDTPTRRVPFINVELRPVKDFCPGMAYKQMEDESAAVEIITVEMEVTIALILYLEHLGETADPVLYDMARSIGYEGLTVPQRTRIGKT